MKRLLPVALVCALLLATSRTPFATAGPLSSVESDELQMSYSLLSSEFYKKIDPQTLLNGAHTRLVTFLQRNGIASPSVPSPHAQSDQLGDARELDREVAAVASQYGGRFGSRQLTYEAITGLMASVNDKYTVFLTPREYAALNEGLDGGNFSGVGIAIRVDDDTKLLRVTDIIPGGPAERAGLQPGDIILTVDGKATKGLTSDEDAKMLRGREGTMVRLVLQRNGATLPSPVAVTRAVIHQPSVYARLLRGGIGYARLTVFGANTAQELSAALDRLDAQGAKAYVLDLRDNGGGYLNAAIDVSSKFVPSGPIVSVEARGGSNTQYDAENTAVPPKPLAVLVNGYTASASEITSGAIQDNGVGELIGTRTYGKGVVQTIHPLPDGSAVKITSARYLTPRGRDINTVGIEPDIKAPDPAKNARFGELPSDTQLQAAVTYLQGKLAQAGS
ncbi:MAG: S41 family peptidase [Candidatus Eremiobacteraeota bacterium]|nr:S41 family peptidase [Candidatus Eremiobacteraeota bacterium]MBV9645972.1 S41 family peptidase [Candidatus Eremiobacteraeota bacterium]